MTREEARTIREFHRLDRANGLCSSATCRETQERYPCPNLVAAEDVLAGRTQATSHASPQVG